MSARVMHYGGPIAYTQASGARVVHHGGTPVCVAGLLCGNTTDVVDYVTCRRCRVLLARVEAERVAAARKGGG